MLSITGPERSPYTPGASMWLWEGDSHIGTVQEVMLNPERTQILLDRFVYADTPAARRPSIRPLCLFEVASYLVEQVPTALEIVFTLSHRLEAVQDQARLATARSRLLESMGAEQIKVVPRPTSRAEIEFVVEAVWHYNTDNLVSLRQALDGAREVHRLAPPPPPTPGTWLSRFSQRKSPPIG